MTESFTRTLTRHSARAGALGLILALAACADKGAKEETAKTPPADPPAAAATDGTATAVGLANCPTPSEGRVHFKVNEAVLAIPGGIVLDAIPAGMTPPITKEGVMAEVSSRTTATFAVSNSKLISTCSQVVDGTPLVTTALTVDNTLVVRSSTIIEFVIAFASLLILFVVSRHSSLSSFRYNNIDTPCG